MLAGIDAGTLLQLEVPAAHSDPPGKGGGPRSCDQEGSPRGPPKEGS